MKCYGIPVKVINIMRNLWDISRSSVRVEGFTSEWFLSRHRISTRMRAVAFPVPADEASLDLYQVGLLLYSIVSIAKGWWT